jgi:hypothetical protein
MAASEISLFDVEDVVVQPKVRDMIVAPVSVSDVAEFARRYHYTGFEGSALWRWGLWNNAVLHGVVAYNLPTRSVCESVFGPDHFDKVWHMGRLVLSEDSPRNSESRLIGLSLKEIEKTRPGIWAVLTYADPSVGHIGTVYQATNAIYTGRSDASSVRYYIDKNGKRHGTRATSCRTDEAETRGWTLHRGETKHRYVYILGNKTQRRQRLQMLKYPILPYPKQTQPEGQTA